MRMRLFVAVLALSAPLAAPAQNSFVNFENLGIHGLDMTPDGERLLVANTADGTLEIFNLQSGTPKWVASVPVGVDPVAVRARSNDEAWLVNHISDSVSIVNLNTLNVVRTLKTLDEPTDVVFSPSANRAFVCCSQPNRVLVFDLNDLAIPPIDLVIKGEDPRAMATSPDGSLIYVAVFESGNATTVLGGSLDPNLANIVVFPPNVVNEKDGPYGGVNPPPNDGDNFSPPQNENNPSPPPVSLIVRKAEDGRWLDDNDRDWTEYVSGSKADKSGRVPGWDMPDRDLAIIDAETLDIRYATRLMTMNMAVGVNPASGDVTVIGTEAINEVRFEPNVNSIFSRVHMATVNVSDLNAKTIVDLNPHLDYTVIQVEDEERDKSIGDPRFVVWNAAGTRGYVAGMGSNNVIVVNPAGERIGINPTITVGAGPMALTLDESRGQMYVLNRFENSISVVDLETETQTTIIPFHDATPPVINAGRHHLYNTRTNSGLGSVSCATCHVDGRIDRLAWDLGDPAGEMADLANNNLGGGIVGLRKGLTAPEFEDFHPMKGPMTTQTLQDIIGHEPLHWRGDREGIRNFGTAFHVLLGNKVTLNGDSFDEFEAMLDSITFPPNPFRNFDNTLPTNLPLEGHFRTGRFGREGEPLPNGNAKNGLTIYTSTSRLLDRNAFACSTCHTLPTGGGTEYTWKSNKWELVPYGDFDERRQMLVSVDGSMNRAIKVPQLRNEYDKVGFTMVQQESLAGFGVFHDGCIDTLERFVAEPAFDVRSDQEVANLVAFILSISGSDFDPPPKNNRLLPPGTPSKDVPASVGAQVTFDGENNEDSGLIDRLAQMVTLAQAEKVGLIAKGVQDGVARGFMYDKALAAFQPDRSGDAPASADTLRTGAANGAEMTFTVVARGTQLRLGIDRDEDTFWDRDEVDGCSNPADSGSTPENADRRGDMNCTCNTDFDDIDGFVLALTSREAYEAAYPDCNYDHADVSGNGSVDFDDIDPFVLLLIP